MWTRCAAAIWSLAAEYLLMAAMLIEIKSRMLLPPKKQEDGEEAEDPRAETGAARSNTSR